MCTTIQINYAQGAAVGRTMDIESPVDYQIIYLPKDYHYGEDLMGDPLVTQHRVMGLGFHQRNPLKDGINEHGLIGVTNEFAGNHRLAKSPVEGRTNVSSYEFLLYALATFQSVEELVAHCPKIHLAKYNHVGEKVISPLFHHLFTDATGRCVVLEPDGGRLRVFDNPYQVMTNSPEFPKHRARLEAFYGDRPLRDFKGAKKLPGGYDPVSRFLKAYYLTQQQVPAQDADQAMAHCYNILAAMTMPKGFVRNQTHHATTHTAYTSVYDTTQCRLTVKSWVNPMVYTIDFDEVSVPDQRHVWKVPKQFATQTLDQAEQASHDA